MRMLTESSPEIDRLAASDSARDPAVVRGAARIVNDVRRRGDRAVREWAGRLDHWTGQIEVPEQQWRAGWGATPKDVRRAIRTAVRHVGLVARRQRPRPFSVVVAPGVRVDQRVQALSRVGCYVPGGRHPLPSTLVMTVVPAVAAGVPEIVVACPQPSPVVLCAALEAGATRLLRLGGAQAIAALAYGTASIARVDKIVGPGNAWVAAAKALVSRDCAVDAHAGPSEIIVFSDSAPAEWIAADLLAQAEHDPDARAILVTTRQALADAVAAAIDRQTPRTGAARIALRRHGAIVVVSTRRRAIALVNRLAPEHLVCDRPGDARQFTTAGTVFVGRWSAQAAGDYVTGSNHVLPTGGHARFRGGLSTADFVRSFTVQRLTRAGLATLSPPTMALANAEGLSLHAQSIAVRLTGATDA
jgi:histidinol dehydrogenase